MDAEALEKKRAEIRARVAEARKQQDLEIAKKQAFKQAAERKAAAAKAKNDNAATKAPTAPAPAESVTAHAEKPNGDGAVLRIDEGYADFKVLPKDDERGNPNFPHNLHNACELFCRTGNVRCAINVSTLLSDIGLDSSF